MNDVNAVELRTTTSTSNPSGTQRTIPPSFEKILRSLMRREYDGSINPHEAGNAVYCMAVATCRAVIRRYPMIDQSECIHRSIIRWMAEWPHIFSLWDQKRDLAPYTFKSLVWITGKEANRMVHDQHRFAELPDEATVGAGQTGLQIAIEKERASMVQMFIQRLPRRQRTALVDYHFHGKRVHEIAASMGITPSAASGLIFRGHSGLRRMIEDECPSLRPS